MARVLPTQKPIRFNQSHHEACSLMHCAAVCQKYQIIHDSSWAALHCAGKENAETWLIWRFLDLNLESSI